MACVHVRLRAATLAIEPRITDSRGAVDMGSDWTERKVHRDAPVDVGRPWMYIAPVLYGREADACERGGGSGR